MNKLYLPSSSTLLKEDLNSAGFSFREKTFQSIALFLDSLWVHQIKDNGHAIVSEEFVSSFCTALKNGNRRVRLMPALEESGICERVYRRDLDFPRDIYEFPWADWKLREVKLDINNADRIGNELN